MIWRRHVDSELMALADGTLGDDEERHVRRHLEECRRCRQRADEVRHARTAALRLEMVPLPAQRAAAIRAAVAEHRRTARSDVRQRAPVSRRRPMIWRLAASAAAIFLVVMAGSLARRSQASIEWPQWRGPGRDGKSLETGLLKSWPDEGPPLVWTADGLGSGYASVSISEGRIFTMGDGDGGQYVVALGLEDGRRLWATRVGDAWSERYVGPRATPTVDGRRLYAMTTGGDVVCLDTTDGSELWRHSLPDKYDSTMMKWRGKTDWRFSESPLVDGDRLIVTPGTRDAALVALDKRNGQELWRSSIPELGENGSDGAGYSSAVVSEGAGVRQYIQFLGRGLVGVEAETGRFLWGYNRLANDVANVTTPVATGDYIFAANGFGTGSVLLRLVAEDDGGVHAEEIYHLPPRVVQNQHGGLILHDGYVYTGTGHGRGRPVCVELSTGEVAWGPVRGSGDTTAAIAYADDRLYFRYADGRVVLVEATPEGYREHGSFIVPGVKRESWSHPVIAGGRLYLREQDRLLTYDVRAPS